ncbi:MAG: 2'-5' RNA ligase family protein [Candidatus Paceibacterota bacterium]|jgi:2'-5' RNA ligase
MKYFIGYLIKGEASDWHINLTKDISEKFNTWKIYERLPPHITIFYPFETDDVENIKNILRSWVQYRNIIGNFIMSDFDRFDDNVVFAKIEASSQLVNTIEGLRIILKDVPGMPKDNFLTWHPHATLANKLTPQEIKKIWEYVQTLEKPNFMLPFDNVTLFRLEGDKWIVEESFDIFSV